MAKKHSPMPGQPGWVLTPSPAKPLTGQQFQQLEMFHAKPDDAHRWPRGYTPERQREMGRVIPDVGVPSDPIGVLGPYGTAERQVKVRTRMHKAGAPDTSNFPVNMRIAGGLSQIARSRVLDTAARSTMDPSHFKNVRGVSMGTPGEAGGPQPGSSADYNAMSGKMRVATNVVQTPNRLASTLAHEVGHAVDRPNLINPITNHPKNEHAFSYTFEDGIQYLGDMHSGLVGWKVQDDINQGKGVVVANPELEGFAEGFSTVHTRFDNRSKGVSREAKSRPYDHFFGGSSPAPDSVKLSYMNSMINAGVSPEAAHRVYSPPAPTSPASEPKYQQLTLDGVNIPRIVPPDEAMSRQFQADSLHRRQARNQRRTRIPARRMTI